MKSILIVGSRSKIAEHFVKSNHGKYRFTTASSGDKTSNIKIDFRESMDYSFDDYPELSHAIIFSSSTDINSIESNPERARKLVFDGPKKVIEVLNKREVKCLVLSTTAVFNENTYENHEQSVKNPSCQYGLVKSMLEDAIMKSNLNSVVRMSKVFTNPNILKKWDECIEMKKPINAFSDLRVAPLPVSVVSDFIDAWINDSTHSIRHISPKMDLNYYQLCQKYLRYRQIDCSFALSTSCRDIVSYKPKKANLSGKSRYSKIVDLEDSILKVFKEWKENNLDL